MPETAEEPLPDYSNPPLVETILGLQFDPIPGLTNAHLGAFWKAISVDWPSVADAMPLPSQFEQFNEAAKWANMGISIGVRQEMPSRVQIKNKNADRMIQIQNGRFHFNWLGRSDAAYPRYATIRQQFVDALEQFTAFVARENLGEFRPNQWEVTYLNHIAKGIVWKSPDDWSFFKPLAAVPTIAGLVEGESFSGAWRFAIPQQRGRLHVQWEHGLRHEPNGQEVIVLTFTARGPIHTNGNPEQSILDGVDLGHETIVRSFARLMTSAANGHWGLKNANAGD
jgi:uncharacterized protein (TIGR04255 family)